MYPLNSGLMEDNLMKITNRTRIMDLIKEYPFLEDFLIDEYPDLKLLKNKVLRKTVGKKATLGTVSDLIKENTDDLISVISAKIKSEPGAEVEINEITTEASLPNGLHLHRR